MNENIICSFGNNIYDFQNSQLSLDEIHRRVEEMLKLFDDETDNGKLYIRFP